MVSPERGWLGDDVVDEYDPFIASDDLVGRDAYVTVGIPRTAWGTVSMEVEGMNQEFRATSSVDIERGEMVHITGATGNGRRLGSPNPPADAGTHPHRCGNRDLCR